MNTRVILVANRGPRSNGSLATTLQRAVHGLGKHTVHHYVATDRFVSDRVTRSRLNDGACILDEIPLNDTDWDLYYAAFCNTALYFLFLAPYVSCLAPIKGGKALKRAWNRFYRVNRRFAHATYAAIREHGGSNPQVVWVHDQHPLLVAKLMRAKAVRDGITLPPLGWFLHHPFPPAAEVEKFRYARQILKAMLAYDLIGFQTQRDRDNFHAAVIACGLRPCLEEQTGVFPISIDVDYYRATQIRAPRTEIIPQPSEDVQVILTVERVDPAKGILERLKAFDLLLRRRPDLLRKVVLVQVGEPSRKEVEAYQIFHRQIAEAVARINEKHATDGWTPVVIVPGLTRDELGWLYHHLADVLLVSSLRDGQNLILQEAACMTEEVPALAPILSCETGAAAFIGGDDMAHLVEPTPEALSVAMEFGLAMPPEERRRRMTRIRQRVEAYTVHHWVENFVRQLEESR